MENSTHEKRLKKIEAECAELRRQILKLEFQNKKDTVAFRTESNERWQRFERLREQTQRHLNHLSQLTGLTFEIADDIDDRLDAASKPLVRKRQRVE